ncbi:MAG: tyrosine-type recombinase/integrase [Pseudomonadota bacterium]|nr:tyrosine-type recombinase/integrase [Pseudomonadota bacterium]
MRKHHPENERIKRRYFIYLREAKRLSEHSVDQAAAAIAAFETATRHRDFRKFHIEQARRFKRTLDEQVNAKTGKPLAKATIHARLMALKAFFQWLADQPGYRSRISYADAEYFNPSANDGRIARTTRERPAPTLEQIRQALKTMPSGTPIQRRDRALIAFAILTGARDNALASLKLKHVDTALRRVVQDAREVRTKRAKTIISYFFPVGEDIEAIATEWLDWLTTAESFSPEDPLFPRTHITLGESGLFEAVGLDRAHWSDAAAIRRIFREAFEGAGLPYFHPHSFRHTLVALGERYCRTPEDFKAWSQNLGHEQVLTTFTSYGPVAENRQGEILATLGGEREAMDQPGDLDPETLAAVRAIMRAGRQSDAA